MGEFSYSKEILKRFKKPKYYGEIKNPDGFGKAGNPNCLLPEEKVHKNSEAIEISKLEKNQRILTHLGGYEEITSKFSRKYKGETIILKNKLGKLNLTPEHLIYAISVPKKIKFNMNKNKKKLIPAWYHAEQLKKRDIILYPKLKKEKDIKHMKINISKSKWDFKSKKIPNKIPLNSELLKLFGYFLSEGNIQDKPCKTYISFSLNIKENDIVEDIKIISKKLFGLDVKIDERPKNKTIIVFLYNAQLARWFKSLFGNGACYKKIPDFIMNLPKQKQKSLIFGLWKGDGYVNLNRKGPRAGYATISYQLAHQIKTLLLRQNIVPSIYEEKEKESNGIKHKKAYRIHVGQRDSLKRLCNILETKYNPKGYETINSWFDENYLYTPITDKHIKSYNGKVFNIEVKNIHSFVSESFCLHNCGDMLYLYLRIGKNKKGEFIKDIKFKTLGCPAAIAVSDMVCELAKGKTIKEAKKITNKLIADKLKKLPTIKYHCSLLGEEALRNAIKDYEKKKSL